MNITFSGKLPPIYKRNGRECYLDSIRKNYARRNSTAERDPVFDGYTACSDAGNHFGAALIALWNYEQKEGRYRHLCAGCRSTVGTDRSD